MSLDEEKRAFQAEWGVNPDDPYVQLQFVALTAFKQGWGLPWTHEFHSWAGLTQRSKRIVPQHWALRGVAQPGLNESIAMSPKASIAVQTAETRWVLQEFMTLKQRATEEDWGALMRTGDAFKAETRGWVLMFIPVAAIDRVEMLFLLYSDGEFDESRVKASMEVYGAHGGSAP